MVGLVGAERRIVQIEDACVDPRYKWQEALEIGAVAIDAGRAHARSGSR